MLRRRVILQSPRAAKKKRNRRLVILAVVVSVIAVILVGVYFLFRAQFLIIKDVTVLGTEVLDPLTVSQKTKENILGSYYFFVPKNNIVFYPKKLIEENLRTNFPRIDNLDVKINSNILNITIKEKSSFALWCGTESCYFIDSTGFIFSKAPEFSGNVYKIFSGLIEEDESDGALRKQFLSENMIMSLKKVYDTLDALDVNISRINVLSLKETKLSTPGGVVFIVDITKISDETIENLQSVLASDEFRKKMPLLKGVEYIDLRFGGKVFFKLKSDDAPLEVGS